jgi:hypothetical protein
MEINKDYVNVVISVSQNLFLPEVSWDCENNCFFNYEGNFITLSFRSDCIVISTNAFSSQRSKYNKICKVDNATFEQKVNILRCSLLNMFIFLRKERKKI